MNIFTIFIIGIVFIAGSLLVIDQYKALSDQPKKPKKSKEETLPKDAKVFRPPMWRFILIESTIIGIGMIIGISIIIFFYPPRHSSPYDFVVGFIIVRILMRLFVPLFKVDDLMLTISSEGVTSTLPSRCITFPIHEINQKVGTTTPSEANKWVLYRYMKSIQHKIEKCLGNEYIHSVDGKKIELSLLQFKREQIREILYEVEKVTKAFANNQERVIKIDEAH